MTMTDSEQPKKQTLIDLLKNDRMIKEQPAELSPNGVLYHIKYREKESYTLYEDSNKPATQLAEFCFILDRLVKLKAYKIIYRTEIPALKYIICKYILNDNRPSTKNRVHNYVLYMKSLNSWRLLV